MSRSCSSSRCPLHGNNRRYIPDCRIAQRNLYVRLGTESGARKKLRTFFEHTIDSSVGRFASLRAYCGAALFLWRRLFASNSLDAWTGDEFRCPLESTLGAVGPEVDPGPKPVIFVLAGEQSCRAGEHSCSELTIASVKNDQGAECVTLPFLAMECFLIGSAYPVCLFW